MKEFFKELPKNVLKIFSGYNLIWHIVAIILTYFIVVSDLDWKIFKYFASLSWRSYFSPALSLGFLLPVLIPLILILVSLAIKNRKTLLEGLHIAEASALGLLVSDFYKAFTGRIQPPGHMHNAAINITNLADNSKMFEFGFLRHGVFWGWPSSHATVSFALAAVIWTIFPKNKILRTIAVLYAFYVGIGVFVTSIHWFSEFVAGAIIGSVIGITVGKSYFKGNKEI